MPQVEATLSLNGQLVHEFSPGVYIVDDRNGGRVLTVGSAGAAGADLNFKPATGSFEVAEGAIRVATKYGPEAFEE